MPAMPESRVTLLRRVALGIAVTVVIAAGVLALSPLFRSRQDELRFDAAVWGQHQWEEYSPRYRMVGDLLRTHRLVGMTRAELEALLGPIEYASVNDLYPYPGYDLGSIPGIFGLPVGTTLPIEFGPDGRVVKAWNPGR